MTASDPAASVPELQEWQQNVYRPAKERFGEREERFETPSHIELAPVYGVGDRGGSAGMPGIAPYTRGVQPTMYRGRFWTMRQYSGFGSASETNKRFRYLLDQGQTGLSVAFDLPTQMGYESDHALARPEVGKVGVPINSLMDLETLLDGVPLDKVSTSMTINATASVLLALYVALGKKRGISPGQAPRHDPERHPQGIRGTRHLPLPDPGQHAAHHGHLRLRRGTGTQLEHDLDLGLPHPRSGLDGRAGARIHARQWARLRRRRDREGPRPQPLRKRRLSFFFNGHNHFFEEVAKFRAARRMWATMLEERFGVTDPKARMLRFHTQTAGSMLTSQQPINNVARVTVQALAAVLGGTQSLHTNSMDEALGLPTEMAARTALRTQQILAHESGVADVIDPLGGSPYVEALTDQLEEEARALIAKIDELGGAVPAIEAGFYQREIHRSALEWQRSVEKRERVVVGVNEYRIEEPQPEIFKVDEKMQEEALAGLERVRAERDSSACASALDQVEETARGDGNLMQPILAAVEAYATVGEVCTRLERVFGKYRPANFF